MSKEPDLTINVSENITVTDRASAELPLKLADHLWPGCKITTITADQPAMGGGGERPFSGRPMQAPGFIYHRPIVGPDQTTGARAFSFIELQHEDSPIILTYTYDPHTMKREITASGLFEASNREIQEILPVITRLRAGALLEQPTKADYNRAWRRIEAGEDRNQVAAEFLMTYKTTSSAFNDAMYRRRKGIVEI